MSTALPLLNSQSREGTPLDNTITTSSVTKPTPKPSFLFGSRTLGSDSAKKQVYPDIDTLSYESKDNNLDSKITTQSVTKKSNPSFLFGKIPTEFPFGENHPVYPETDSKSAFSSLSKAEQRYAINKSFDNASKKTPGGNRRRTRRRKSLRKRRRRNTRR